MFSGFFQCVEMKKKYSLKRNEEIAQIVHKHRLKSDDCFTIYYQNNEKNQHSRVCISVSKKNGNAVIRNKIKRQVREMITDIFDLDLKLDYVIVVKNKYLENNFSTNKEKLNKLYLRITCNKGANQ